MLSPLKIPLFVNSRSEAEYPARLKYFLTSSEFCSFKLHFYVHLFLSHTREGPGYNFCN